MKHFIAENSGEQKDFLKFEDINYIKKHLRYPIVKFTFLAVITIITSAFFPTYLILIYLKKVVTPDNPVLSLKHQLFATIILIPVFLISLNKVVRKVLALKFIAIDSNVSEDENSNLVKTFLETQHFVIYRHPIAKAVFQIVSLPIGYQQQREVVVFIADHNRILLNSHFINEKKSIFSDNSKSHLKELSHNLKFFLENKKNAAPDNYRIMIG